MPLEMQQFWWEVFCVGSISYQKQKLHHQHHLFHIVKWLCMLMLHVVLFDRAGLINLFHPLVCLPAYSVVMSQFFSTTLGYSSLVKFKDTYHTDFIFARGNNSEMFSDFP